MLHLLECGKMQVLTIKSHFAQDIVLEKNTSIFCTAPSRICIISNGTVNKIESVMMDVQWKTFQFFHQIEDEDVIDIPPSCKCFADLVINISR